MLRTFLFTLLLAIVFFVAERYLAANWVHHHWKVLLLFFLSVSFLLHRLVEAGLQSNSERFITLYLAATVVRLILSFLFVGFFLYQNVTQRLLFVVTFLVLYICYTSFEIWGLNRNLRRDSK
ncbi:hypothetical protein [Spirosoma sp. KUDC1026]|uniref:hypothetical protein n=1 Tax=Spirosoma sp. KUDC1026 TaxID=2745947 RepID=UPI00159BE68B|nr:hypothetical protein [Spirosoma sp. KUDC1026]QKZ12450.1 hypothetical protein HU175_07340 [Spirosoma sp. KUDC1026]